MASLNDIEAQIDTIIDILSIEQENNAMLQQIITMLSGEAGVNDGEPE